MITLFKNVRTSNEKLIKVLGVKIKHHKMQAGYTKKKYIGGLIKIELFNNGEITKFYILGIKIFTKQNQQKVLENLLLETRTKLNGLKKQNDSCTGIIKQYIQAAITVANHHQKVFPQFKNKHKGQTAVIVATGPSMLHYEPIEDAVHIGVNTSYLNNKIKLDYWFSLDKIPMKPYLDALINLDCIKFFGQTYQRYPFPHYDLDAHYSNTFIEKCTNSYKYYMDQTNYTYINPNIETQMLPDLGSCVFQAAMFALYAGFEKIYLVGCDSAHTGYFNNSEQRDCQLLRDLPKKWALMKKYASIFYPESEFISINPVGLKNLFTDFYTQSYLDEHPEITYDEDCEPCLLNELESVKI